MTKTISELSQATQWHNQEIKEIIEHFQTTEHGLTSEEAQKRLDQYGVNQLPEAKTDSLFLIFFRQFQSPLIYILLIAAILIYFVDEPVDSVFILIVLLFNAIIGTFQEGKAQNTLKALKQFVKTNATVLRDEKELVIPDLKVVPGDIIILQEGEKVPVDARVILSNNLRTDEAAVTGESKPIHKITDRLNKEKITIAEQKNMVFKGTHVVAGNGKAIVVATGLDTAIGKISKTLSEIETEIPLKKNIRYLSRLILMAVAVISAALFIFGILTGRSAIEMLATVISLSVSIIPEGLPVVITLVLATGVWRMSKKNALVKRLQAVEALGQAQIIAVDKTGTITKNEIVVQKIYLNNKIFEIKGIGYEPKGDVVLDHQTINPANHPEILTAGKIAMFCSNARIVLSEKNKIWKSYGDPTEAAMLVFAEKLGFQKDDLEREAPRIFEVPFDYRKRYHAVINQIDNDKKEKNNLLSVAGAPETILNLSNKILLDNKNQPLTEEIKKEIEKIYLKMSADGLRVIALAMKPTTEKNINPDKISGLILVGILGMKDALRPEVHGSLELARSAGIKVVMITGDHKITAQAIAQEAEIYRAGDKILSGEEIDQMTDEQLKEKITKTSVFARVTPEHKLKIIEAYKSLGQTIAMTGDGVNDAPSLVAADLGVSMGKIGTEVAKEASDIILLDDDFGTIVTAVEEGRSIYKTIKKVVLYLFSTSLGEVLTITGSLFLGYPLPILPVQIIWLNLVTDGILVAALAMEPKEEGLLKGKFKKPKKYIVDRLMAQRMLLMSLPMMIGTLILFRDYFEVDMIKAWTISLTVLAVFQWFNVWNCRSESKSIFHTNPFNNKYLLGSTITIIFLHCLAIYHPFMQRVLRTTGLDAIEWLLIIIIASSIILVEEIRKIFYRRRQEI